LNPISKMREAILEVKPLNHLRSHSMLEALRVYA